VSSIRSFARRAAAHAIDTMPADILLRWLERSDHGRGDLLAVMTYHRVIDPREARGYPGLVSADPQQLAAHAAFVARRYRVIGMDDLLDVRETGRPIGPRAVMITFDDAYRDFADHAWPILRRLHLPVTLFVPTGYVDDPSGGFWWDSLYEAIAHSPPDATVRGRGSAFKLGSADGRMRAYRQLRAEIKSLPHDAAMDLVADVVENQLGKPHLPAQVLNWPALRALAADGVTLAPHTRRHPLLDGLDEAGIEFELRGSMLDLEEKVGPTPRALAYPSGAFSDAVRAVVVRTGYAVAFTTRRGVNRLGRADWLALRRINVGAASSLNVIRAQLGRWAQVWSQ
jgi:peptidoglycan/xylan/chitin deacetylase (PgdA/CDA1 family)